MFLLSASTVWLMAALLLIIIASLSIKLTGAGERALGYVSSAVTFLAACFAGIAAIRKRKKGALFSGIVSAVAIITVALTLGILISSSEPEPGAVLSLVSFTLAGGLVGAVFFPGKRDKPSKKPVRPGRRC